MMVRFLVIGGAFLIAPSSHAQVPPTLADVLDRMSAYLLEYETQLSSVVADERLDQRVVYTRTYDMGRPVTGTDRRRLDSEIGFIRLPGGMDWLGFRDVKKVNGRTVPGRSHSIADALGSGAEVMTRARAIATASAAHNLGVPRTTNVPTAALEVIHPRHRERHAFELRGEEQIERTRLAVVHFDERQRPTLVKDLAGHELASHGRIWLEPQSGAIWRVEWTYAAPAGAPFSLRIEFRRNETLGFMVPTEMREQFQSFLGRDARGDGVAVYSNYRRFGTGARIVPQ